MRHPRVSSLPRALRSLGLAAAIVSATFFLPATPALANVVVDTTFSGNGFDRQPMGFNGWRSAATIGNRTVAVGSRGNEIVVTRYTASGKLDTTFGGDGTRAFQGEAPWNVDVQIDSQIRIVVFYRTFVGFEILRLLPSGPLDTTFSHDGHVVFIVGDGSEADYAIDSLDRPVIVKGRNKDIQIWRRTESGARDMSFSGDGELIDDTRSGRYLGGIDTTSTNEIIVFHAGFVADNGDLDLNVTSYASDGASSSTVETVTRNGLYPVEAEVGADDSVTAIAAGPELGPRIVAIRVDAAGDLDPGFAGDGIVSGPCDDQCGVWGMTLDGAGSTYLTGTSRSGTDRHPVSDTFAARLTPGGQWDESFASGGMRNLPLFDAADMGMAVALDDEGRVLVVGSVGDDRKDGFVARLVVS